MVLRQGETGTGNVVSCTLRLIPNDRHGDTLWLRSTETGLEAIERLRFLASFPLPGTGKREGGEKTQPFNCFASHPFTQQCRFLSQEVGEISRFFVAPPRAFPLSVWATFTRDIQIVTKKCTHLSTSATASKSFPFSGLPEESFPVVASYRSNQQESPSLPHLILATMAHQTEAATASTPWRTCPAAPGKPPCHLRFRR